MAVPETRAEWILLVLGLCAVCAIGALIGLRVWDTSTPHSHAFPKPPLTTTRAPARQQATPTTAEAAPTLPPPAATRVELLLTASRGDTWLLVRAGSANGGVVFQGTLAKGHTLTFSRKVLWVRFGAAANLDARLNGRPLRLPTGTVSVVITPLGLR
jgi:hypothetical protein